MAQAAMVNSLRRTRQARNAVIDHLLRDVYAVLVLGCKMEIPG